MKHLIRIALGIAMALGLVAAGLAGPFAAPAAAAPVASAGTYQVGTASVVSTASSARLANRCKTTGRVLCIDKTRRKLYFVQNGRIRATVDARFGCARTPTRNGTFRVYRKNKHWVSTIYHTAMPYSMFFSGGQAVHYSSDFARRGYYGCSHGCVNIRNRSKLAWIYARIHVGDKVVVYRS
ncbi:MAG TPA: L,D-transpeptidase [Microlunatus sp.]|nr:L,D-transpeptidase [Microlunatus sp.]